MGSKLAGARRWLRRVPGVLGGRGGLLLVALAGGAAAAVGGGLTGCQGCLLNACTPGVRMEIVAAADRAPLPVGSYEISLKTDRGVLEVACSIAATSRESSCMRTADGSEGYYELAPMAFRALDEPVTAILLWIVHMEDGGNVMTGPPTLVVTVTVDGAVRATEELAPEYEDLRANEPAECGVCEETADGGKPVPIALDP